MKRTKAYTLTELLVAMTIVLVLAGLFVPLLIQAKEEAKETACAMNFKQVYFASTIYQVDYDDKYVVPKYAVLEVESSEKDRTWVQLIAPYLRNVQVTRCPSDYTQSSGIDPVFDPDLVFGADAERFYQASMRANTGFNFVNLSPMVLEAGNVWTARPRSSTEPQDPARTLVFGDSVWTVTADGRPTGGGSYLIIPPCRIYAKDGADSFGLSGFQDDKVYTSSQAWDDSTKPQSTNFGGLWPWHTGRLNCVMADGSVKSRTVKQVSDGCKVKPNWEGKIIDSGKYLWDLR